MYRDILTYPLGYSCIKNWRFNEMDKNKGNSKPITIRLTDELVERLELERKELNKSLGFQMSRNSLIIYFINRGLCMQ